MDLAYGVLRDTTPDRVLEGYVEGDTRVAFVSIQHQVEWDGSGTVMALLPILQSVSPETPKFWGSRRDFKPVVANEEEIVRALLQPFEGRMRLPNEVLGEYVSKGFGWNARGYVQQRVSVAFEFDDVPIALFDLLVQGSYQVDVGFTVHASARFGSVPRNVLEWVYVHRYQSLLLALGD